MVALDGFGDEPVELRGSDLAGDGRDLHVDPPGRFDRQRGHRVDGGLGDRPRPPRRHPTRLHLCPQPREAVPQLESVADEPLRRHVEMPRTVPSSATQNSATIGQPSPAMGSSTSRPMPRPAVKAAAWWIDSGGWRSAHRAARASRSAAARSSVAFRSRSASSSPEASRPSTSAPRPAASVSIMCSILDAATDNDAPPNGTGARPPGPDGRSPTPRRWARPGRRRPTRRPRPLGRPTTAPRCVRGRGRSPTARDH